MAAQHPWCIIINNNSCSRAHWHYWEQKLEHHQIPFQPYFTDAIDQLTILVSKLVAEHHLHFLFAGGDGTLHHGATALLRIGKEDARNFIIGILPCGTGNDWHRTFGVSNDEIINCLRERHTAEVHILQIDWPDGRREYAFNMIGGALDAMVVKNLQRKVLQRSGKLKYAFGLIYTLLKRHLWPGKITTDEKSFEGSWLSIQAGFGKYCGGGMLVLPHAQEHVPALLLMKPKSLISILTSIPKLYNGKIIQQREAVALKFRELEISPSSDPVPLEADGEWLGYSPVKIIPVFNVVKRLSTV